MMSNKELPASLSATLRQPAIETPEVNDGRTETQAAVETVTENPILAILAPFESQFHALPYDRKTRKTWTQILAAAQRIEVSALAPISQLRSPVLWQIDEDNRLSFADGDEDTPRETKTFLGFEDDALMLGLKMFTQDEYERFNSKGKYDRNSITWLKPTDLWPSRRIAVPNAQYQYGGVFVRYNDPGYHYHYIGCRRQFKLKLNLF